MMHAGTIMHCHRLRASCTRTRTGCNNLPTKVAAALEARYHQTVRDLAGPVVRALPKGAANAV